MAEFGRGGGGGGGTFGDAVQPVGLSAPPHEDHVSACEWELERFFGCALCRLRLGLRFGGRGVLL